MCSRNKDRFRFFLFSTGVVNSEHISINRKKKLKKKLKNTKQNRVSRLQHHTWKSTETMAQPDMEFIQLNDHTDLVKNNPATPLHLYFYSFPWPVASVSSIASSSNYRSSLEMCEASPSDSIQKAREGYILLRLIKHLNGKELRRKFAHSFNAPLSVLHVVWSLFRSSKLRHLIILLQK